MAGGDRPRPPLTTEVQRAEALRRWRILRAHVEDNVPLSRVAADAEVPLRTGQRWLARYRAEGLRGLARPSRLAARALLRLVPTIGCYRSRTRCASLAPCGGSSRGSTSRPAPAHSAATASESRQQNSRM
ncbi:leucine zipper domain-containing protein [Micromonospora sp. DT47]|uniref:leucine zipper domain-containing protein n=1 Tax=Micromonospora sp. DT47 TaxID=3393431 RepID=UPI003CEE6A77